MTQPLLVMLAGPNGAGKSTFYETFLRELGLPFLNANVLAREANLGAYEAADTIASIRNQLIEKQEGFIAETVFSDPVGDKVNTLARAAEQGFDVTLIYIGIESSDLSERRVRARVAAGGHDVPPAELEARYQRSLDNLERAIGQLPRVIVYDNSSFESPYRLLGEFEDGSLIQKVETGFPNWAIRFF